MYKRYTAFFASVLLACSLFLPAVSISADEKQKIASLTNVTQNDVQKSIDSVTAYLLAQGISSEWEAIGLAKAGVDVPASYEEILHQKIESDVIGNERLKITDVERIVLAAVAIGKDPTNVNDFNLLDKIYNSADIGNVDTMIRQGTNGLIFALIALDTKNFEVPNDARWNRQQIITELLKYQRDDGAWSLSTSNTGPVSFDMTAMALISLAPYTNQSNVSHAVDRAVSFLSESQEENGGFNEEFVGGVSSEATSQVIIGLTANKIDPQGPQFTKNGSNLVDHLLSFQSADGGFKHTVEDANSNNMATEQAFQALVAFDLFTKGEGPLYSFTDVPVKPAPEPEPSQFTDIKGHGSAEYILQAVEKGIFNGYKDNTFKPNQSLTRVQAVAVLVRALDLKTNQNNPFADTKNYTADTQAELAAAYAHGLVKGVDGKFMPTQKVTRAQMALMLYRAYEVQNGKSYKINQVAPFRDINSYNLEAIRAMTMLYDLEMAKGINGNFKPGDSTTRAQAAKMIVQFLNN